MRRTVCAAALAAILAIPAIAAPLSEAQRREAIDFAIGNVVWVLYHEIGHFLINDFQLPVLGREEDAVDNLATVILLQDRSAVRDSFLIAAVDAFFLLGEARGKDKLFEHHTLDEQRAFQVACMMYGSDPEAFGPFAKTTGLPDSRRATCPYEYQRISSSWFQVLTPYRTSQWTGNQVPVVIDYANTEDPRFAELARTLFEARVFEVAADYLSRNFVLRTQPTLQARSCESSNAFYEPQTRTVVVCYELMESFRDLLEYHLSKN